VKVLKTPRASRLRALAARLRGFLSRTQHDDQFDEEIRQHLRLLADRFVAEGMSREEAARSARRQFGNPITLQEDRRALQTLPSIESRWRDLCYALRMLRRNPGFSILAVLVLALGIGANTAVFTVADAVLFKPLAFADPDRLVSFGSVWPTKGTRRSAVSLPDVMDWRAGSSAFSTLTYYRRSQQAVIVGDAAYFEEVVRTSPEFFGLFGVTPMLGRFFAPDEDSGARSVVISHDFWRTRMAQSPDVLNMNVRIGSNAMTVIGVLPPGFVYPDGADLWHLTDAVKKEYQEPRGTIAWTVLARLQNGVTIEQAQAQLTPIAERLEQQYPATNGDRRVEVARLQDFVTANAKPTLFVLLAAVSVVLLIACGNVATVLLAKATARANEVAVRAALGAGRGRIVGQLLTESLVLALLAGCLGALIGTAGSDALLTLAPVNFPRLGEVGVDTRVLLFTLAVSVVTTVLFGLAPAMHTSRIDLNETLKRGMARGTVGGSGRLSRVLLIGEIALSVVLVTAAGLLIRSFVALNTVELGFKPDRVLVVEVSVPREPVRAALFYRELLADLSSTPGVIAAGASMGMPGRVASGGSYWIDRLPDTLTIDPFASVYSIIMPGTLRALDIPLKRGRDFNAGDTAEAPKVAMINETLAGREFGNQDPIGRTIIAGYDQEGPMTIVGIIGDVRQRSPAEPPGAEVLMPYEQHLPATGTALRVLVRTRGQPEALENAVRAKVRALSMTVPMRFTTMEQTLTEYAAAPFFRTILVSGFGLIALCLAVAGIYGVLTCLVGQRTREIGLRMALGATRGTILRMVIREGAVLAAAGMVIGMVGAIAVTRLLGTLLFQIQPYDPLTYAGGLVFLGVVTLVACYIPASRAAGIDPLDALRVE
jgi:putative ABC transport system permease protein